MGVELPGEPSQAQQADLAWADGHAGAAFDSAWLAVQAKAHRETLADGEKELSHGAAQAAMEVEETAAPKIQHHLEVVRQVADKLGVDLTAAPRPAEGGRWDTAGAPPGDAVGADAAGPARRALGLAAAAGGLAMAVVIGAVTRRKLSAFVSSGARRSRVEPSSRPARVLTRSD